MAPSLTTCFLAAIASVLALSGAPRAAARDTVHVDLSAAWQKRDWQKCRSRARTLSSSPDLVVVQADTTEVLFWQVPTTKDRSVPVVSEKEWARRCERPPLDFGDQMRAWHTRNRELIELRNYPQLSWRWRVDRLVNDARKTPEYGFTVRIGITLANSEGSRIYEIAYVWSRSRPENEVFVHETSHAGGLVRKKWHRIVAESGEDHLGTWVQERRDLLADFRRLFPGEEPGLIVRLYVRHDTDFADLPIASYADVHFLGSPP